MEQELVIRFAEPEDMNTVGYLAQQIWPETYGNILSQEQLSYMLSLFYSPASLHQQVSKEKHTFLIAELDEEPIAFASFSPDKTPGKYKLHKIYVHGKTQGKGIGKALIDFIVEHLSEYNAEALILNVNRHNKAKTFYERLGFVVTGEEDINIGNGYFMNDYVMERKL
ncbi:MAG: GNAT family N-acetyltransferase [Chitinophagaceae bacterium]